MYEVKWKDKEGIAQNENVKDLSDALTFAKDLGIQVTIHGGGMEIVGVFGSDAVKEGKLPDGTDYSWYKRRNPNA